MHVNDASSDSEAASRPVLAENELNEVECESCEPSQHTHRSLPIGATEVPDSAAVLVQ